MKSIFLLFLFACALPSFSRDCVILLHGLARSSSSMKKIEEHLLREGFAVANVDYPSRKHKIEELSKMAMEEGLQKCSLCRPEKIHFVTHSLGGILVRYYLSKNKIDGLGRTVMLGPPNHGSEAVDRLKKIPGYEFINGPAGQQLGTGKQDIPKLLGPANFEVGIIAGTQTVNPFLSMMIPSEDDGKVSTESAHLQNEKDYVLLPVTHLFMMMDKTAIKQVIHFLKSGMFLHSQP